MIFSSKEKDVNLYDEDYSNEIFIYYEAFNNLSI